MSVHKSKNPISVSEIVKRIALPARIAGSKGRIIRGVAALEHSVPGMLCFCRSTAEGTDAYGSGCGSDLVIIPDDERCAPASPASTEDKTLILTKDPMLFFIHCLGVLFPEESQSHKRIPVNINSTLRNRKDITIDPTAVIDDGVEVGAGSVIESGVRIHSGTLIGKNVVIQSNAVIGSVGVAYGQDEDGQHHFFPHLGKVVIEDDVVIGPHSVVTKGILQDTVMGSGTKMGNLVNVGHNVRIGRHCHISAGVIFCGSVQVGDRCWVAPGAILMNRIRIGDGTRLGLGTIVTKDIEADKFVVGVPGRVVPAMSVPS